MAVMLEDWRYRQLDRFTTKLTHLPLRDTEDQFRLYGRVHGHPTTRDGKYAYLSQPADFDETKRVVTTASGSQYTLGKCHEEEAEQMKLIHRDVARYRKANPPAKPFSEPASAASARAPRKPQSDGDNTIISLDMDSDEDPTFGRVFGHDEDDRDIDTIVAEALARNERLQRERDEREALEDLAEPAPRGNRKVYEADQIEPL